MFNRLIEIWRYPFNISFFQYILSINQLDYKVETKIHPIYSLDGKDIPMRLRTRGTRYEKDDMERS